MGKKPGFYAVARGHNAGVYLSWDDCKDQVSGYSNARYKKFDTRQEAMNFVNGGSGSASNRSISVGASGRSYGSINSSSSNYGSGSHKSRSTSKPYSVSKPAHTSHSSSSGAISSSKQYPIYIDGASRGNGKSGIPNSGFGVYFGKGDSRNRGIGLHEVDNITVTKPTNQRAELHALKYALQHAKDNKASEGYEIFTDSMYSKNCIEKWSRLWEKNGWKNSSGTAVANQDLIKPSVEMYRQLKAEYGDKLNLSHVKGHLGNDGNEAADRLANDGADAMAARK